MSTVKDFMNVDGASYNLWKRNNREDYIQKLSFKSRMSGCASNGSTSWTGCTDVRGKRVGR